MLVATIKDLNKSINYNVYANLFNNKIDLSVKYIDDEKYMYLNKEEIIDLFKNIFDYNKKYITNHNDYDLYLDENGNKHYFKNGKENIELFFKNNGTNALMYNEEENTLDKNVPKSFYIKNTLKDMAILITTGIIGINCLTIALHIDEYNKSDLTFNEYVSKEILKTYNYVDTLEVEEIKNKINDSNGLSEEEKEILINEEFFDDVLNTINRSRNHILREKLDNVTKVFYTEEELINNVDTGGFYNSLEPNLLHIKNEKNDTKGILIHEFIHLIQDDNPYYFVREAVSEIVKEEYYGERNTSYLEEVKYIKVLMEIIGPKPIFECCFKGDTTNFENAIVSKLNTKDSIEMLSLLRTAPFYCKNKNELYSRIESLLEKMYKGNLTYDNIINTFLEQPTYINRGYFSKSYIEKCDSKPSYLYTNMKISDALDEGLIGIECYAYKIDEIPLDEFLNSIDEYHIDYSSLPYYSYEHVNKTVVNFKTNKHYTLKEAIELGYIYDVKFYKTIAIDDVNIDNVGYYKNNKNTNAGITIFHKNNVIDHKLPTFEKNENGEYIPYVELYLKRQLEPIYEKFPEQFEEKNIFTNFKK